MTGTDQETAATDHRGGGPALTRRFVAIAENVAPVRRAVERFVRAAGVADPGAVALAVHEAMANAVVHAYADESRPGPLVVEARRTREGVEVVVIDEGRGMTPRPDSPGMGLGLPLVATIASRFDVRTSARGGTQVTMLFAIA
jgi:serine/threonine-protein kinase RsbW/stage II sporulation protein AB (anti-sigma F factor)